VRRLFSPRLLSLTALLFAIDYAASPFLSPLGGRVDLLYLVILDYAFFLSWELVPFFAVAVGLTRDFLGGHLFGIETAALAVTGILLYFGVKKLERENAWVRAVISFLFVLLSETLSITLGGWLEAPGVFSGDWVASLLLTTIYTTAFSPVFFWFTNLWFRRMPALKQYELFR